MSQTETPARTEFSELPISQELQTVVKELGFTKLTPIQAQAIPLLMECKDLIGQSKTGSGKTAAFAIPILERLRLEPRAVQALILCPTRELCTQVAREIRRLGRRQPSLQVLLLCGGMPGRPQSESLRKGAHIVVGTPGRTLDHLRRGTLSLSYLTTLVLDEADRMLDMGFEDEVEAIMVEAPGTRQTVLFSATFPDEIKSLSSKYQHNPVHINIQESAEAAPLIRQIAYDAEPENKYQTLLQVLKQHAPESAIIFCNQKLTTAQLDHDLANEGMSTAALHGDLEQADRDRVMAMFRNRSRRILVATDVAARGLDIANLDLVINYDLPHSVDDYIHRIGRTGRAGKNGEAVSIVAARERMRLYDFGNQTGATVETGDLNSTTSERRAPAPAGASMQTLRISGGRKEKVRPGDILGAITGEAGGLDGGSVGKIEIHEHFSYVAVSSLIADVAVRKLQEGRIKGRKFMVRIEK